MSEMSPPAPLVSPPASPLASPLVDARVVDAKIPLVSMFAIAFKWSIVWFLVGLAWMTIVVVAAIVFGFGGALLALLLEASG